MNKHSSLYTERAQKIKGKIDGYKSTSWHILIVEKINSRIPMIKKKTGPPFRWHKYIIYNGREIRMTLDLTLEVEHSKMHKLLKEENRNPRTHNQNTHSLSRAKQIYLRMWHFRAHHHIFQLRKSHEKCSKLISQGKNLKKRETDKRN